MSGATAVSKDQLLIGLSISGGTAATLPFSINGRGRGNSADNRTIEVADNVECGSDSRC